MRQIVLDTETTGLEPQEGHRIIEIGCVELLNRRVSGNNYHVYLNPEREIDAGAVAVHGLTDQQLAGRPLFADVVDDLLAYLDGAELIIHNAAFDVGFINHELKRCDRVPLVEERCTVLDTLALARERHPGQKNSLDALCKRYEVDNSQRELHGALLDARLLAEVYLAMTGGQADMQLERNDPEFVRGTQGLAQRLVAAGRRPRVIRASAQERAAHRSRLEAIAQGNGGTALWPKDADA